MKEVLTNPIAGYYMHNDVFGQTGDFVTSPELGQLFGEMVAVWFLNEWKKIGSPRPFQIVELGPGRGSLCQDILRVFKHFNQLSDAKMSLVEISPFLSDIQARKLCLRSQAVDDKNTFCYHRGITSTGMQIEWYRRLQDVPKQFTLYLAHEFFDALPIHKYQMTSNGWREILVDVDKTFDNKFRYVLSKIEPGPGAKLLLNETIKRDHVEISIDSVILVQHLAERLEEDGGIALIADYGHNGLATDTFRAFKKHKLHDPLLEPGSADLTADVDFKLLKCIATQQGKCIGFGPLAQRHFLTNMGINNRLHQLFENATLEQQEALKFAHQMMTDESQMGERFKLISLFPQVLKSHLEKFPVVGFS